MKKPLAMQEDFHFVGVVAPPLAGEPTTPWSQTRCPAVAGLYRSN